MKYAIIGAGVSGLTCARILSPHHSVTVFEKEHNPGGLIRCVRINGSLFHLCGGHVFNSKRQDVLDWFWKRFDRDNDFLFKARNSSIFMPDGRIVSYPIENHIYQLDQNTQRKVINDLISISSHSSPDNFGDFLRTRFGETLFHAYFDPYNQKIWRKNLNDVPLEWLEGKLPMPNFQEILYNNFNHIDEKQFVHSSFYYSKKDGSQFLANYLADGLDVRYDSKVKIIAKEGGGKKRWLVGNESFDRVIFCGNIKDIPSILSDNDLSNWEKPIADLEFHGTTSVFAEIDPNPYTWIYLPDNRYAAHRIICTGNLASSNQASNRLTATIEFTDEVSQSVIEKTFSLMPLHPHYITHQFNPFTYPIQKKGTRSMIRSLKDHLAKSGFFMTGRFVDWEYYNVDAAIGAAINLCQDL